MSAAMNKAVNKNVTMLAATIPCNRLDASVLALIAAEMYFRGRLHRSLEYCAWLTWWLFRPDRLGNLSVGVAQVQLKNWVSLKAIPSMAPTPSNLWVVASLTKNYEVCLEYLKKQRVLATATPEELSEVYCGRARAYHAMAVGVAMKTAVQLSLIKANDNQP
ncbi:hypothetical protein ACJZRZ_003559 [Vibrio parahaemolyticus]